MINKRTAFIVIKGSYDIGIIALDRYNAYQEPEKLVISMINLCFALESAFKSILNINNIVYEKTHSLNRLFNYLPNQYKKYFINYVLVSARESGIPMLKTKNDFFRDLKDNSMLYINLRYFELDRKEVTFKADFIITLSDIVILTTLRQINPNYNKQEERITLKIRELRKQNGIPVRDFAKQINVTEYVLNSFENHFKLPDLEMLIRISKALNIKIDDLLE